MIRGRVIIIPSEDKISDEYFEAGISMNHLDGFQSFSDKYNLGYKFSFDDYQQAPLDIAGDGHLVLKTLEDVGIIIFYIPRTITPRQLEWARKNIFEFRNAKSVSGFTINDDCEIEKIYGSYSINNEIQKRSMLYAKKEDDKNVGKKI